MIMMNFTKLGVNRPYKNSLEDAWIVLYRFVILDAL